MKELRQRLIDFLVDNGFILQYTDDKDYVDWAGNTEFRKVIDNIEYMFLLVMPHEGTNGRIMLRAERERDFDRWSVADYQRFFTDEEDFKADWKNIFEFDDKTN